MIKLTEDKSRDDLDINFSSLVAQKNEQFDLNDISQTNQMSNMLELD